MRTGPQSLHPARGILRAVGYDVAGGDLPEPVTRPCEIENLAQAA
jgi:hypothetical protein